MLHDELSAVLRAQGASLVGFADVEPLPEAARQGLPVGVSIAMALAPAVVDEIITGPTPEYYQLYLDVNAKLTAVAEAGAAWLRERGYRAVAVPSTQTVPVDLAPVEVPHKTVATRAGLGWVGKCALLVTEPYGSAVRLASILTDAPLPVAEPVEASRCGECSLCVRACPGNTSRNATWQPGMARDDIFDAHACLATLMRFREERQLPLCGICIAACPWTQRYLMG
jgi:epoxyqueuosine reductase QueG